MGVIRWMSAEGDTRVAWKETDAASMERARAMVERAFAEGRGVFSIDEEGVGVRMRQFDPAAREIVVIPQIKGGKVRTHKSFSTIRACGDVVMRKDLCVPT
jgi:hypothetical protein